MSNTKVSLIVPVYNSELYLKRCLDSLVNQSLDDLEIICVNDGSTDSSESILKKYSNKYKNIIVFKKENGGSGSARNFGIDYAKGEYIGFVDSDDILEIDAIEKMYLSAKKFDSDLVVCGMIRINEETGKILTTDMTNTRVDFLNISVNNLDELLFINPGPCNKLHKNSLLENFRFSTVPVVDDLMLMLQYIPYVKKISFIKEPLYHYKFRQDSSVNTVAYSTYEKMKDLFIERKNIYLSQNLDKNYINYLSKMAYIHIGVSILYRMGYIKNLNLNNEIAKTIKYLNEFFPEWKSITTLKHVKLISPLKLFIIKCICLLYKIGLAKIFIKLYIFIITKLKIDIKW